MVKKALPLFLMLAAAGLALSAQDRGLAVVAREIVGSPSFDVGRQYAVIIGIDKYQEWSSLRSAVAEAKQVKALLERRYYIDEFIELYDQAATASAIRRLFAEELPKKLGIADSLLVFYAGHGYLDSSKTGFWIASDGVKDIYDQKGWLPNAQLRNFIGQLKAQRILVVADSCFSGDFLNVSRGALPDIDSAYFKKALQLTARQILTSGASESVPDESEFGRQFLNFLERNTEPVVDPISMYERIRRGVSLTEPLLGTIPGHEQGAAFALFLRQESGSGAAPTVAAAVPAKVVAPARIAPEGKGLVKLRQPESQKPSVAVSARLAGAEGAEAVALGAETPLAIGAWVVEAMLRGDVEPSFRTEISVADNAALTLDLPLLQFSKPYQRKVLQTEYEGLAAKLESARISKAKRSKLGWIGIGVGAACLGVAGYGYIAGVAAYEDYSSATLSADADAAWARVALDNLIFNVAAPAAGVFLGTGAGLLFISPLPSIQGKMRGIESQLELLKN